MIMIFEYFLSKEIIHLSAALLILEFLLSQCFCSSRVEDTSEFLYHFFTFVGFCFFCLLLLTFYVFCNVDGL